MAFPLVISEDAVGFRKFKTYWQDSIVESAIFKGRFYRRVQQFRQAHRLVGYQESIQLSLEYDVLITVRGKSDADRLYTVWADNWHDHNLPIETEQDPVSPDQTSNITPKAAPAISSNLADLAHEGS